MSLHNVEGTLIDGATIDVLYKLHFHGDQESGDLPSKEGMDTLRNLGWAITDWKALKSHFLTTAGKTVAESYYTAKWERGEALASRDCFTMAELRTALDKGDLRWMSQLESNVWEHLPGDAVFQFLEEEGNPAYVARRFRNLKPGEYSVTVSLLVGDRPRGIDCIAYVVLAKG